jgi:excisionase family DNA binding protein
MELMTEQEAADRLHLSKRRLQDLCRAGQIGFVQVTPRIRVIGEEHILEYIKRHSVVPPKKVDKPKAESLRFPRKGGDLAKKEGDKAKASLRKEMRQWQ